MRSAGAVPSRSADTIRGETKASGANSRMCRATFPPGDHGETGGAAMRQIEDALLSVCRVVGLRGLDDLAQPKLEVVQAQCPTNAIFQAASVFLRLTGVPVRPLGTLGLPRTSAGC